MKTSPFSDDLQMLNDLSSQLFVVPTASSPRVKRLTAQRKHCANLQCVTVIINLNPQTLWSEWGMTQRRLATLQPQHQYLLSPRPQILISTGEGITQGWSRGSMLKFRIFLFHAPPIPWLLLGTLGHLHTTVCLISTVEMLILYIPQHFLQCPPQIVHTSNGSVLFHHIIDSTAVVWA